jgi:hypothetical protein
MPIIVKRSEWNQQFKSYNKTKKCPMTGTEAAERNADERGQAREREALIEAAEASILSLNAN